VCVLGQLNYDPVAADWGRGMRGNTLISAVGLQVFVRVFAFVCVWTEESATVSQASIKTIQLFSVFKASLLKYSHPIILELHGDMHSEG